MRGRYGGFRAQISGKALNLVPYDAGDTPQACVRAVALRHAEALEGFLTTQVLLGKQSRKLLSNAVPAQRPSSMHCSQGHPAACAAETWVLRALCLIIVAAWVADMPHASRKTICMAH